MGQNSKASFLNNQLVWRPCVLGRDRELLGVPEIWISDSPAEASRDISSFLNGLDRQGADSVATLAAELPLLRELASQLSDTLRESRSVREATENGSRLKSLMQLIRLLESHYFSMAPRRDGTTGD
jgi:hypothetical protein